MSRVANAPVPLPSGVEIKQNGQEIAVKGAKGEMTMAIHDEVELTQEDGTLKLAARNGSRNARA